MRVLLAVLVLTCSVACSSQATKVAPGPSAPSRGDVRVYADCEHPAVIPKQILVACGDGSFLLTNVSYTRWTETSAKGTATAVANDFTPNRAAGKDHAYQVTFTLDKPIRTSDGWLFSRLSVHYRGAAPYGKATETFPLAPA